MKAWDTSTIKGKIAVMQAAGCGKPVQAMCRAIPHAEWMFASDPCWDWAHYDYRIVDEQPSALLGTVTVHDGEGWRVIGRLPDGGAL